MPLTRNSNEQKITDMLSRIEHHLIDKENIIYSYAVGGILFQSENGHNRCTLSRCTYQTGRWKLECENTTEDWTRVVLAIVPDEEAVPVLPEMIRRWCYGEGSLFNVRSNGQIPPYQACRTNGRNHRLPINVDYDEYIACQATAETLDPVKRSDFFDSNKEN